MRKRRGKSYLYDQPAGVCLSKADHPTSCKHVARSGAMVHVPPARRRRGLRWPVAAEEERAQSDGRDEAGEDQHDARGALPVHRLPHTAIELDRLFRHRLLHVWVAPHEALAVLAREAVLAEVVVRLCDAVEALGGVGGHEEEEVWRMAEVGGGVWRWRRRCAERRSGIEGVS